VAALDSRSVVATRLSAAARERDDGQERVAEFRALVEAHRDAGSELAGRLLAERHELEDDVWLVEPVATSVLLQPTIAPGAPAALPSPRAVPRAAAV
jgi:hypothetical protein